MKNTIRLLTLGIFSFAPALGICSQNFELTHPWSVAGDMIKTAQHQAQTSRNERPKEQGIPLILKIGDTVPEYLRVQIDGHIELALNILFQLPPDRDLQESRGRGRTAVSKIADIAIYPFMSDDPQFAQWQSRSPQQFDKLKQSDMGTVYFANNKAASVVILVPVERFYSKNSKGVYTINSFYHLLFALSHNFHGRVYQYFQMDERSISQITPARERLDTIAAYEESVAFGQRFIRSRFYTGLNNEQKSAFLSALENEKILLQRAKGI